MWNGKITSNNIFSLAQDDFVFQAGFSMAGLLILLGLLLRSSVDDITLLHRDAHREEFDDNEDMKRHLYHLKESFVKFKDRTTITKALVDQL